MDDYNASMVMLPSFRVHMIYASVGDYWKVSCKYSYMARWFIKTGYDQDDFRAFKVLDDLLSFQVLSGLKGEIRI